MFRVGDGVAYRFKLDPSPGKQLAHVIHEQIERALAALSDRRLSLGERVHRGRTSCKRIRAALRLARACRRGEWRKENAFFRDAARELAPLREATVMPATVSSLLKHFSDVSVPRGLKSVRRRIRADCRRILSADANHAPALARFARRMREARRRADSLKIGDGTSEVVAGFGHTYRWARRAGRRLEPDSPDEHFHEWRKRVKAHGYHCRLFRCAWPEAMKWRQRLLGTLGDQLGEEHDLSVLEGWLSQHAGERSEARAVACLRSLLAARRKQVRQEALVLGQRLFVDRPSTIAHQVSVWWETAAAFERAGVIDRLRTTR